MTLNARRVALTDMGDLHAPIGSREWAVAVRIEIQCTLSSIDGDAAHLRRMLDMIREHKGYAALTDRSGRPFASFQAFCEAKKPHGLGYNPADIEAIIRERSQRQAQQRAQNPLVLLDNPGPATRDEKESIPDNVRNRNTFGNNADYLVARLARDRPDILERMKAGEFNSVRAAAREAGIVRPTATFYTDDPDSAARAILKHFEGDRLAQLVRNLVAPVDVPTPTQAPSAPAVDPTAEEDPTLAFESRWDAISDYVVGEFKKTTDEFRWTFAGRLEMLAARFCRECGCDKMEIVEVGNDEE